MCKRSASPAKQLSVEEYIANYQVTPQRMKLAKPDAILMHPGPVIRGMELTSEVADGPQSCIHEQVRNGVKTRMAILATLLGAGALNERHGPIAHR